MIGEDWLVSEFICNQDEAMQQVQSIQMIMEQERQRMKHRMMQLQAQ